jgi:hypothetical protein
MTMGYSFVSANGDVPEEQREYDLNLFSWSMMLDIAQQYGWKPMGTVLIQWYFEDGTPCYPEPIEWDGGYMSNDGQAVNVDDAKALANALESALDDIPEFGALTPKVLTLSSSEEIKDYIEVSKSPLVTGIIKLLGSGDETNIQVPNSLVSPLEYFSGKRKHLVIEFIEFCRRGLFFIW